MTPRLLAAVERVLGEAELIDDPNGYYGMLVGAPAIRELREAFAEATNTEVLDG